MDQELKAQRRHLRELVAEAYERELAAELTKLEAEFTRWRAGEIDPFQLSEAIHHFHQEPARALFSKYSDSALAEFVVANAIARGVISEQEADLAGLPEVQRQLALISDLKAARQAQDRDSDSESQDDE